MHLLFAIVDNAAQNSVFRGVIYVIMRYGCVNCQGTSFLNDESVTIDFNFYCALINKYDFIQAVFMSVRKIIAGRMKDTVKEFIVLPVHG